MTCFVYAESEEQAERYALMGLGQPTMESAMNCVKREDPTKPTMLYVVTVTATPQQITLTSKDIYERVNRIQVRADELRAEIRENNDR